MSEALNDFSIQEPKLSAARRIVTEWTDYDQEMHMLGEQIAKDRSKDVLVNDSNIEDDIAIDALKDRIEL